MNNAKVINGEQLYPCIHAIDSVRKAIQINYIRAKYRLENANSTNERRQAEYSFIKACKALERLNNNVYNGSIYCLYTEKNFIKGIAKSC